MLDWLVVGGGVQGVHLSIVLLHRAGVGPGRLRVLDPHDVPLRRWYDCTSNTGMVFLRTPAQHHLDLSPRSLERFAAHEGRAFVPAFAEPYHRPSLALFNAHASHLIARDGLQNLYLRGTASGLERCHGGWRVETADGGIESRHVVLAIGATDQLAVPSWAAPLMVHGAPISHIFDPDFRRSELSSWGRAVVVGGGISAVQVALALAHRQPGQVVLLPRHPLHERSFDVDECWSLPACLRPYHRDGDPDLQRAIIQRERHYGSVPPELMQQVREACERGNLALTIAEVAGATLDEHSSVVLRLRETGELLVSDGVVLATGFEGRRPGGGWLDRAIERLGLPCASCGYPLVDRSLEWQPGLFVCGPLADLGVGPIARSIGGARYAARQIARGA